MADPRCVVVTFGVKGECGLSHCPMDAKLFESDEAAEAYMESLPAWMQPHRLLIRD